MSKSLIIVESPAKVKTIRKFLGSGFMVSASVGHIRDLPRKSLAVDEKNNYEPQYEIIDGKEKVVAELKSAAAKADVVYLAPDPDREGEAIAWHIAELIKEENTNVKRIQFNEITSKAVHEAIKNPRELDHDLFDAQQARRILDRLVGYKISPLLWNKVKRGISAGRVQSVALRIIVEREEERRIFVPEEYWLFKAFLAGKTPPSFRADLLKIDGKKPVLDKEAKAKALEERLNGQPFVVESVEIKNREKSPVPPFITSSLQQAANQRHGYPAKRTMNIAQKLYEGIDIGERGLQALITYMRTDSVRISDEARDMARNFIISTWGKEYYPEKARVFKSKGSAQDAHEAIRPVDPSISPDSIKSSLSPEQYNIYRLIWSRFLASQMSAAKVEDCIVTINCAKTEWRAKGERILFPGFLILTPQKNEEIVDLPALEAGQIMNLEKLETEQKFTQPPARYSEASLVKELEEKGIGRPSTYASIISTLQDRTYVEMSEKHFVPTDLGSVVCGILREHFKQLMDVGFTAQMEEDLDKVAEGKKNWVDLMRDFSKDFDPTLVEAAKAMKTVKAGMESGLDCPDCGKPLLIKFGKSGQFLACSGYPGCGHTSNFIRDEQGNVQAVQREKVEAQVVGTCPACGKDLVLKNARTGSRFIACSGYPACKHAAPFSTGVACPRCKNGSMVEKSSRRGKIFYSCDQYPNCDFALWDWPVAGTCPDCGGNILVRKTLRGKNYIACPEKACSYKQEIDGDGELMEAIPKQPVQNLLIVPKAGVTKIAKSVPAKKAPAKKTAGATKIKAVSSEKEEKLTAKSTTAKAKTAKASPAKKVAAKSSGSSEKIVKKSKVAKDK